MTRGAMTRAEFTQEIRKLADAVGKGKYHFLDLKGGACILVNPYYGEIKIPITEGTCIRVELFEATAEEKNGGKKS